MTLLRNLLGRLPFPRTGKGAGPASSSSGGDRRKASLSEKGLLVFPHTSEVIRAERCLKEAGFLVKVMGPPPDLRTGCDMVLVFPLMEEPAVRAALESWNLEPLKLVPLRDLLLEPVSLFQAARIGSFLMVRAANMKMTVEVPDAPAGQTADGIGTGEPRIVNISGGGCPDVPYLAGLLVGRALDEAEEPRLHGRTLCSYALQKAFEETRRILASGGLSTLSDTSGKSGFRDPEDPEETFSGKKRLPRPAEEEGGRAPNPRSWLVCGTAPDPVFPLCLRRWRLEGNILKSEGEDRSLAVKRGTPALLAAAALTCETLGVDPPEALLVGDVGSGEGSRALYRLLAEELLPRRGWGGLTFHYLFPDIDGHNRVLMAVEERKDRPLLVADAGFMYAAKMSGYASRYDLFTPDVGELAFLADEKAPHPFYTRGFLLEEGRNVGEQAAAAARHGDSARMLLVKGAVDYVFQNGEELGRVERPCVPAMEPIGGTGDLVTGMVTGFLAAGWPLREACMAAARAGRIIGRTAMPTPAFPVADLLPFLPEAVSREASRSGTAG